ncbi:MAG: methyltransferase domain-containing protein, partial [Actinobacteria bacterium]|nr:methyltransferase domain-containing protein [Actinomycetota bacterium]
MIDSSTKVEIKHVTRHCGNAVLGAVPYSEVYLMDCVAGLQHYPDNYFDGIWMVHVIEHLHNGDAVIQHLLPKLKSGGFLYIEYPGQKSTTLPSMHGTLNFKDDPTHVRVYSVNE